jgi:hypothetical protein
VACRWKTAKNWRRTLAALPWTMQRTRAAVSINQINLKQFISNSYCSVGAGQTTGARATKAEKDRLRWMEEVDAGEAIMVDYALAKDRTGEIIHAVSDCLMIALHLLLTYWCRSDLL